MQLWNTIYRDLCRKRTPSLKNFIVEYIDFNSDKCFKFTVWLRLVQFCKTRAWLKYTIGVPVYCYFHHLELKFGIFINTNIEIGPGLSIIHRGGVFINCESIGENFTIYHNVTLGSHPNSKKLPKIANNVKIYTGSVVCGDVVIGDDAVIGANSYIDKNVPDNWITRTVKTEMRIKNE